MQGSNGETDRKDKLMDMQGCREEEEGEMYGESNMETYITICKIDSQWEFAVCFRKPQNRGSVSTWRGGMGREMGGRFRREGTYVHLWLIHVEV